MKLSCIQKRKDHEVQLQRDNNKKDNKATNFPGDNKMIMRNENQLKQMKRKEKTKKKEKKTRIKQTKRKGKEK